MKIALLVSELPSVSKHGPAYQMHYLANKLVDRGHEVTIFSQNPRPDDAKYEVKIVETKGRGRIFKYMWQLSRIDYSGFDVVHASGDDALLFLSKNKPYHVRTFMGSSLKEALHMFKQPKQCLKTLILAFFEYVSVIVADKCVLISEGTRRYIPFVKSVVYCGVDLDEFRPGEKQSENPSILFVGTMGWRKRGKMLLDLFRDEIKKKVPAAELWLVVRDEVSGEGIKNFGRVSTEKLIELYQQAWVFCLPSTYEGFGLPYIEAMACGTPVVASGNLGAKEVLGNGKYGIIAEDNELGKILIELLDNEKFREEYRQKGLIRVKEFDFEKIVNEYEELYKGGANERK